MVKFNNCYITNNGKQLVLDISVEDNEYYKGIYISDIYLDISDNYLGSALQVAPSKKAILLWNISHNSLIKESKIDSLYKFPNDILNKISKLAINNLTLDTVYSTIQDIMEEKPIPSFLYNNISYKDFDFNLDNQITTADFINSQSIYDKLNTVKNTDPYMSNILQSFKRIQLVYDIDMLQDKLFYIWVKCDGVLLPNTPCGMKDFLSLNYIYNPRTLYLKGMSFIRELSQTCNTAENFKQFILQKEALDISLLTGNYLQANKYWKAFYDTSNKSCTHIKTCKCHG